VNAVIKGSFTDFFAASVGFAPKNVSNSILTIFNSVVGLPLPTTAGPPTTLAAATEAAVAGAVTVTTKAPDAVAVTETDGEEDYDIEVEQKEVERFQYY